MALRVVDDDRRRVEAHRLVVQHAGRVVRGVVVLQPGGVVADLGERRGVGAGEAELGEGAALLEELLGVLRRQAGADGAAKAIVKAKGRRIAEALGESSPLGLPATAPVTVQLVASNGTCLAATYDTRITVNTPDKFQATPD